MFSKRSLVHGLILVPVAVCGCSSSSGSSASPAPGRTTPTITWTAPAAITYGTALGSSQLNASSSAAGTFAYSPAPGTVLTAGTQTLSAAFTPADSNSYTSATASVSILVNQATPTVSWAAPQPLVYGTALGNTQLSASASVPGTFSYSPAGGAVLNAGTQTITATFTPTDAVDYAAVRASRSLIVNKAEPVLSWATPASVTAGTALGGSQLNASASVPGAFAYSPASGATVVVPGSATLQAVFTPTDTANYILTNATQTLTVTPVLGTPAYTWQSVVVNAGGFTDELFFHPAQKDLLYARMDIGSAYRFDRPNSRWVPLLDWVDRSHDNYFHTDEWSVESLALDPTDPRRLYLAVGIGSGSPAANANLLISKDQGATFTNVPLPFATRGNDHGREAGDRMSVDSNQPSRLYYGTVGDGLYQSDDHGLTWSKSTSFPALSTTNAIGITFVLPVATSGSAGSLTPMIFVGVGEKTTAGVFNSLYVSTDAGTTWTPVSGQISGSLMALRGRTGPNHELYVTYDDAAGPDGITTGMICAYTFTDAGTVSAPRNITPALPAGDTAGFYDVAVDPSNAGVLLTATVDGTLVVSSHVQDYIFRSTDDGKTWTSFASDTHDISATPWVAASLRNHDGDWINLAVDPFDPKHVVYATGEMIFVTSDITVANGAVAWSEQAANEEEHNVIALAAPPSGNVLLYSGVHDHNGMPHVSLSAAPARYPNANSNVTTSISYAEGNPLIVARVGGNKDYSASAAPYGAYSVDGGTTWITFANTPVPASSSGAGSIAVSADAKTLVWAPYDVSPVVSNDGGQTWTAVSGTTAKAKKVVADHVNPAKFYVSSMTYLSYPTTTTGGSLYLSTDSGKSFSAIAGTSSLPAGDVYANFATEGDVWLASPYYGLYRNTGTASAINMTKDSHFSGAYHMAFGAGKPGTGYGYTVYVDGNIGGVDGIYRSTDGGSTWLLITDQQHQFGYLNCIEADRRTFGTVYLGTQGRGIIYGTAKN